jgi:(R,R)-butanediol dehydrogenase/meso-butanediol dehydrogenase/diacetyl reductase
VRAVRLAEAGRLELVELPDPEPGPDEVVVRVAACGVCGSDLSCYKTGVFSGSVLGHELAGWVASAGPGAGAWRAGDAVVVDPKVPCGTCEDCRAGAAHRCPEALTRGPGGTRDGGFAELVAVPARCLHRLPGSVRVEDACLVEPLAVALHGLRRAGPLAEQAVVVGCGPIGLLAVAALRAAGCPSVIGVDPVAVRGRLAEELGAERSVGTIDEAPRGVPLVLECSGRPEALADATNLLAAGGRAVLLGVPMAPATVVPMVWVTRELTVVGSIASTDEDFRDAIGLLERLPEIARIVTRRVGLEELPGVFDELLERPADGKVVAVP